MSTPLTASTAAAVSSVTIKTQYGGDIRRFTFDEAKQAANGSLFGSIHSTIASAYHLGGRSFTITYVDEEGDACCVGGDEETREAIRFAGDHGRVLKLNVVVADAAVSVSTPRVAPAVATPAVPVLSIDAATPKGAAAAPATPSPSVLEVKKEIARPKCVYAGDATIADGSIQKAGATIVKEWSVKLLGDAGQKVYLIPNDAKDISKAISMYVTGGSAADTTRIITSIVVPATNGTHKYEYRLVTSDGQPIDGDCQLWCEFIVKPEISAAFVADVTLPDGSEVAANSTILKKWSIRNDGTLQWPIGSLLIHNDGAVISSPLFANECKGVSVPAAKPDEIVEIGVHFTAPATSGRHHGEWHLVQPDGTKFANDYALWTQINVGVPSLTSNEVITSLPKWMADPEVRAAIEKLRPSPSTSTASTSTSSSSGSASAPLPPSEIIHEGITCDGCGMSPIRGLRFKCGNCADFDFCSGCEARGDHNQDHVFIKAKLPLVRQSSGIRRGNESKASSSNWRVPVTPAVAVAAPIAAPQKVVPKKVSPPRSAFQADLTLPDGSQVTCGTDVTKRWSLTNVGDEAWPEGSKLMFVGGALHPAARSDALSAVPLAAAGRSVEVWAHVRVPATPGRHTGYYRLATADGKRFGHRLWIDIVAVAQPVGTTPTPVVTVTAATPTEKAAAPVVASVAATTATPAVAPATAAPVVVVASKYPVELAQLKELGYKDEEMLNELLQAAGGRVQQVVDWLVNPIV